MKIGYFFIPFLVISTLTAGCATLSTEKARVASGINIQVLDADYSQVWDVLISILEGNEDRISVAKKGKGIIKTAYSKIELSEFKEVVNLPDRGAAGGFYRPWLWARYRIQSDLNQLPDKKTRVRILIRYEGWNASAGRYVRLKS